MAVMGLSNALIPIVAFNYGARRMDRIVPAVRFSLLLACAIMAFGTVLFQLIPSQLLSMFNADQSMYAIGIPCLRVLSWSFVFAGVSMILCSAFQALGYAGISLVITLLRQLVLPVPLTWVLARLFGFYLSWYSFVITEILCAGISVLEWQRIKRKTVKHLSAATA